MLFVCKIKKVKNILGHLLDDVIILCLFWLVHCFFCLFFLSWWSGHFVFILVRLSSLFFFCFFLKWRILLAICWVEWSSKGFVASYLAPNSPPRLADHNHHEHKGVHDEDNDDDLFFFINLMMMVIISSWRDGGVERLQSEKNMIQGSWQKISSSKLLKEEGGKKYIHFRWHWNLGSTILFLLKTRWLTSQRFSNTPNFCSISL